VDNDELRLMVLSLIEASPFISKWRTAKELGVREEGVNYCLKVFTEIGCMKADIIAKSRHKLGCLHFLTPGGAKGTVVTTENFLAKERNYHDT